MLASVGLTSGGGALLAPPVLYSRRPELRGHTVARELASHDRRSLNTASPAGSGLYTPPPQQHAARSAPHMEAPVVAVPHLWRAKRSRGAAAQGDALSWGKTNDAAGTQPYSATPEQDVKAEESLAAVPVYEQEVRVPANLTAAPPSRAHRARPWPTLATATSQAAATWRVQQQPFSAPLAHAVTRLTSWRREWRRTYA